MNLKLSDREITSVCGELLARDPATTRRAVEAALKRRYGSSGKTDRVCRIWRELREQLPSPARESGRVAELEAKLRDETLAREAAEQRAILAENRYIAFEDRWAHELHDLRLEVQRLKGAEARRAELESRVIDLTRENLALKARPGNR